MMHSHSACAGLAIALLGPAILAYGQPPEPAIAVRVVPTPAPLRGPRVTLDRPDLPLASVDVDPRIDGSFDEPAWQQAPVAPPPRGLRLAAPPPPDWQVAALAGPGGLSFALRGLPRDMASSLTIDPDGAKRRRVSIKIEGGEATVVSCALRPEHASPPFADAWRVAWPPCDAPLPAQAAWGEAGWEVLVPWAALGATTDDLRVQWWARADGATATFDAGGSATDYVPGGRPIALRGAPARTERLAVTWNRPASTASLTLVATGLPGPESWRYEAHYNGRTLLEGTLALEPDAKGSARVTWELPTHAHTGTGFLVRRATDEPLAPGASATPWSLAETATVATPVHRGTVEIRYAHTHPKLETVIRVRSAPDAATVELPVVLPRGEGSVFLDLPADWPDRTEIGLPDLAPEPWIPVLRAPAELGGGSRRRR